jgi:hypothetical protein
MVSAVDLTVSGILLPELEGNLEQIRLRAKDEVLKLEEEFGKTSEFESWIDSTWNEGWGRKGGKFEADETACETLGVADGAKNAGNMRSRYKKGAYDYNADGNMNNNSADGKTSTNDSEKADSKTTTNSSALLSVAQMVSPNYSPEDVKAAFDYQGFVVFKNFHSVDGCKGMMRRMEELAEKWDPDAPYVAKSGILRLITVHCY